MRKAIIELVEQDNGQLQYAVTKSGSAKLDKLVDTGIGVINLYAKTGGDPQALMGTLGPGIQQQLGQMFGGGGMGGLASLLGGLK
jgi:hypothetical protein